MSKLPQKELLSAYLDGELTAEQKAQAEKLLAEDPSAQAMLDSLREVSSTVKNLPAFELDENLAADVLKIAERRMLADETLPTSTDGKATSQPLWRTVVRRFLTPRAVAWSVAAAMVAIILAYHNPEADKPGPHGEIAMQMKDDLREGKDLPMRGPGEFRAAPAMKAPAMEADSLRAASVPAETEKKEFKAPERLARKSAKKDSPVPPAAKSLAPDRSSKGVFSKSAPKSDIRSAPKKGVQEPPKQPISGAAEKPAAMKIPAKRPVSTRGLNAKGGSGIGMGGSIPLARKTEQGQMRSKGGYKASAAKGLADVKPGEPSMGISAGSQIITVRCQVDSRPAAQKALRQILLAQKLIPPRRSTVFEQADEKQESYAEQSDSKQRKEVSSQRSQDALAESTMAAKPKDASELTPAQTAPNQKPETQTVEDEVAQRAKQKPARPDSISIQATPAQLEKVLAEIRKQPKVFGKCSTSANLAGVAIQQPAASGLQKQVAQPNMSPTLGRSINIKVVFLMQPNEPKPNAPANAERAAP